ncbi:MAG: ABC transporter ATP-binding protein [Candidatus Thorarchaeota archaeon]|nr:MAG: ABC transporter ATP-binding protein [Candidatus Thorarchaeota archaeon]
MNENGLAIQTETLGKTFGTIHAIRSLTLEVPIGSIFGLLGPNGAGKTTTVRILSGLMKQSSGCARVCGLDIETQRDQVKSITGLLPESPGIYSKLSAVEFLEFIGALNRRNGDSLLRRIDSLLSLLGLEERQNDLLESYSSGMKQKVLVASTLLHEPELVFLDEPTSRLDPSASSLVKDLILVLADETETSFFICTHMTSFAEEVCDVIGIICEGKLMTVGSPEQIIESVDAADLEEAYLRIVGGRVDREQLLAWRA